MNPSDTDSTFPFERLLSLHKLIATWKEIADTTQNDSLRKVARGFVKEAEAIPELVDGVSTAADLAPYKSLTDQLMTAVVPVSPSRDAMIGAMMPFKMEVFFGTPKFLELHEVKRTSAANGKILGFKSAEELERAKAMNAFHYVLEKFYGIESRFNIPDTFSVTDASGLDTFYRLMLDTSYIDLQCTGELPDLSAEVIQTLTAAPTDFDLWAKHLPPERFVFKGFTLVTLVDVTEHEVHSRLKNDLLQKQALTTSDRLNSIEQQLRSLLRIPDLRIGVIGVASGDFGDLEQSQVFGRSLLLDGGVPKCTMQNNSSYAEIFSTGRPVVMSDLDSCTFCTGFEYRIREQNYRGLLLAPLKDGDRLIGVLELASTEPGQLTQLSVAYLMDVISLFSAAMVRGADERSDRIQARIKKEFTSIHPSVEWRFKRAAEQLEASEQSGERTEAEDITFEGVYPLYGLSDIRDSTIHRSHAIQQDLIEQLGLALAAIVEASSTQPLPALDELGFRIARYAQNLEKGLTSDVEIGALEFLRNDVEPLFERLAGANDRTRQKVEAYRSAIDPKLGVLYKQRRAYEQSVARVNEGISTFLQQQQQQAQAMFPHYFEKFETDGVDYNIYVGDTIAENRPFDMLYLRNLRLWQLQTMCGIVWELERIKPDLPMALDLAHLVLVQDFPIAIRFSKDEKRFGVDGAYNARYMIVKKRIDKAVVDGTSERITQPGKIAVVYAQEKERREYTRYLDYLSAAGYVEGPIEDLDVEPLQGVSGLRALRAKVSPTAPEAEIRTRPELATAQA